MLLFQYLDALPAIPKDLIDNMSIGDNLISTKPNSVLEATYARWAINDELIDWLHTNISTNIERAGLQKITWTDWAPAYRREVRPHCDLRRWAINYIIELGGPEVTTTFYRQPGFPVVREPCTEMPDNSNLIILEQKIVEPNRWHILNTNVLHGIENAVTQRQAITVGLTTNNPFDVIKGYSGLFDF
jgi:hypothetical protein